MFGGIVFGGVPFAAVAVPLSLAASANISVACTATLETTVSFNAKTTISIGTDVSFREPLRMRVIVPLTVSAKMRATELLRASIGVQTSTNINLRHQKYSRLDRPHFTIEMELDGYLQGWTFIEDVILGTTSFNRGLPGIKSTDFLARTGILNFTLDNSQYNSKGKLGLYTPGHANCLPGFAKNVGVRCVISIDGKGFVQFTGRMLNIRTSTGVMGERRVQCICVDYIDQLARKRLVDLPLQIDATDDEVFALIVQQMNIQPRSVQIDKGFDTLQYAFDSMKAERAVPATEIVRLCRSTLRRCYVAKNGTLTFEGRTLRALNTETNIISLTPADYMLDNGPSIEDNRDLIVNRVQATLHPRKTGTTADVVLFVLEGKPIVQANYPFSIRGFYTEPGNLARRAGGLDMLPAVPGTDYTFNIEQDGSGIDVTYQVAVDTIYTANSVLFQIESPVTCYCTKLQARGTAVTDQANIITEVEDEDSIQMYGENSLSLDMPYNGDVPFGQEVVQYLLYLEQQTPKRVTNVPLLLNDKSHDRQRLIVQREISDRVGVAEPMNSLPVLLHEGHFINNINMSEDSEGNIIVQWGLTLADASSYWYLEVPGKSELGQTTRLGFGLVVGHTDISHIDDHGDITHGDITHVDTHGNSPHSDSVHSDTAHSDVPHSNVAHSDVSHSNAHSDAPHSDQAHEDWHSNSEHRDSHTNVAHQDQAHQDDPGQGYTNSHNDLHQDYTHNDGGTVPPQQYVNTHANSHIDDGGRPHIDYPHQDTAHSDAFTNDAHGDGHNDVQHINWAHGDSHSDVAHQDVLHSDSHSDSGHGDALHEDAVHVDTHSDVSHSDVTHSDSHGDFAHGDAN
jgi:hypothetical protein